MLAFCYYCGVPLVNEDRSEEHIIPNALGGRLKSHQLLCEEHNNYFGNTIDLEVSKQLAFASVVLVQKRDRKKDHVQVKMVGDSGVEMVVGKNLTPRPKITIKIPGVAEPIIIFAKDDEDAKRIVAERKKQLEFKFGQFAVTTSTELPPAEKLYFTNGAPIGQIEFGGPDYFRGIAKIMLNYVLLRRPDLHPHYLMDYVKEITAGSPVFCYHPSDYDPCPLVPGEFSHILHLRGDKECGAIYAYIELFNSEKFIGIVEQKYGGEDFEETYIYDLILSKVINKKVKIQVTRSQLQTLIRNPRSQHPGRERAHLRLIERIQEYHDQNLMDS